MNEDLIRYRLDRAREAIDDAEYLLADNRLRAAVNRLYYGMFYAVVALLETEGFKSSKHSGVRALFNSILLKPVSYPEKRRIFTACFLRIGTKAITWTTLNFQKKK